MGSLAHMFERFVCHTCGDSSFINDTWNHQCPDCTNRQRVCEVGNSVQFQTMRRVQHLPLDVIPVIVSLFVEKLDGNAMFRSRYLRKMLVGPPPSLFESISTFRSFTYWGNGSEGNISETEDIIDRIIAYVV